MGIRETLIQYFIDYQDAVERNALAETPEESADYIISLMPGEGQVKEMLKNLIHEMWAEPKPDSVCDRCELEGREWQPAYATETIDRTAKAICSLPEKMEIDNG